MMEMVLMQAMHVYSIGMEMPGHRWGNDLDGEAAGDYFGYSVALSSDGKTFAVGGIFNDGNGADAGHARVLMEMVLMQAMHVYSIGMEMPGRRGGMTWMEKQQVIFRPMERL
uniref:Uncharacterized protein n=1 Tax=Ditylum brightwellii TaxID=49249 RepID=A0A7S4RYC4_9STRA